jgi:translation initiation factor 1
MLTMRNPDTGGLVYSTEGGRMCPACRHPVAECACRSVPKTGAQGDGTLRVSCETKGRGGKAVTVIRGLDLDNVALAALGKRLRTACGAGGAVKDGVLEVQGDHRSRVVDCLKAEGWTVKLAGG